MFALLILSSLWFASILCNNDEPAKWETVKCVDSKLVIEEKPDAVHCKIVTYSGENLFDVNSKITNVTDLDFLFILSLAGSGSSTDYYVTKKLTDAGTEIKLMSKIFFIVFEKTVPAIPGAQPDEESCARINDFDVTVDPTWDIRQRDGYNASALYWACLFGKKDLVESLVDRGADVNQVVYRGSTPLMAAIGKNDELVEFLIEKGADVNGGSRELGYTPLHKAAQCGTLRVVALLLGHGAEVNRTAKDDNATPLHLAAYGGHDDIVSLLISKGANVNATTKFGTTPLHFACLSRNLATVRKLVEAGADLNSKDKKGNTPLIWALMSTLDEESVLDIVRLILAQPKVDVNSKDNNGKSVLALATEYGHSNVQELLRAKGAV